MLKLGSIILEREVIYTESHTMYGCIVHLAVRSIGTQAKLALCITRPKPGAYMAKALCTYIILAVFSTII